MTKHLLTLLILFCGFIAGAQIVITEISYNPPESGSDSLEYIELYNNSGADIDLTGYTFSAGVTMTFTGGQIDADSYLVVAGNSDAVSNVFGVSSMQWEGGALSNGGEFLELSDGGGNVVDEVQFDDENGWPDFSTGTDGAGGSIELCDINSDNNMSSSWRASTTDVGVMINGFAVKGTPGADNNVTCEIVPDATITAMINNTFDPADVTIDVGQTVRWMNGGGFHNVNGTLATYPGNPEGFGNGNASGDAWTFDYTFTIPGVYDYQCDPHASLGMVGTVTVNDGGSGNEYPANDIVTMSTVDANGVADSIGRKVTLTGIVHGINFRPQGLTFSLIDANNNGIGVFSNSGDFGYTVTEGDEIAVKGTIEQFGGLTQIEPVEITIVSTGNALVTPKNITAQVEDDESSLLQIVNVTFVDPSQWGDGTGSGFNVEMTDGSNNFEVRIDSDTELFNLNFEDLPGPPPYNVVGLGGQFDTESPFDEGYQLLPRYTADFITTLSTGDLSEEGQIEVYPIPSTDVLNIRTDVSIDNYAIMDNTGRVITVGGFTKVIDIERLPNGLYHLALRRDHKLYSTSFIKE